MAYPVIGPPRVFNPQQQVPMTWPAVPVVALAYIDQLLRDDVISQDGAERISTLLSQAKLALDQDGDNRLSREISNYRLSAKGSNITSNRIRLERLDSTLKAIALDLRK